MCATFAEIFFKAHQDELRVAAARRRLDPIRLGVWAALADDYRSKTAARATPITPASAPDPAPVNWAGWLPHGLRHG